MDTFFFAINLYNPKLKLINESDENVNRAVNTIMDGSISNDKMTIEHFDCSKEAIIKKLSFKAKKHVKTINPIKDGLCITTVRLLKVTLINILKHHVKLANNTRLEGRNKFFVPVKYIINKMRVNMLVQEQINKILYGSTYSKSTSFLHSEAFSTLSQGIQEYYDPYLLQDNQESEQEIPDKQMPFNNMTHESKKQLWARKLTDFLMKSDEKWILDQYNLIKLFLFQNSWDCKNKELDVGDFSHPAYEYYYIQPKSKNSRKYSNWEVGNTQSATKRKANINDEFKSSEVDRVKDLSDGPDCGTSKNKETKANNENQDDIDDEKITRKPSNK